MPGALQALERPVVSEGRVAALEVRNEPVISAEVPLAGIDDRGELLSPLAMGAM